MSQYRRVNVLQCQLSPRRCVALERSQNVYPHIPANYFYLPPRAQPHSCVRLPTVPWRGKDREWTLGRTVTAPTYTDCIPQKRSEQKAGVPPGFRTVFASLTLGAILGSLFLGLQHTQIVGLLSYRQGRQGRGGGIAGEESWLRRRLSGDPHPAPTSHSPGARQLRAFPVRGGGLLG